MATNSIAGWIWLGLALGGIGYAASQGIRAGVDKKVEIEKERNAALVARLNERMGDAIVDARSGDIASALAKLERLAEEYPDRAALWLNIGIAHRASGNVDKSMAALDRALELAPNDWDIVAEKATVLIEAKKPELGVQVASKIPPRLGRMPDRLRADPTWVDLEESEGSKALREKHGVAARLGDTGIRSIEEMDRQIKAYPEEIQKRLEAERAAN